MNVTYLRYLRSDLWREKRRRVLERDGYRCQVWRSMSQPKSIIRRTHASVTSRWRISLASAAHVMRQLPQGSAGKGIGCVGHPCRRRYG